MSDEWIVIPNWDKFQHYRDRRPAWIKCYSDLLFKDEYLSLTPNRRALLHGLWITYARTNGEVPHNTLRISSWLNMKVTRRDLEALNDAGFIEFSASKPLAKRYPRDRERERIPKSLTAKDRTKCPVCQVVPMHSLAEHMQTVHHQYGEDAA